MTIMLGRMKRAFDPGTLPVAVVDRRSAEPLHRQLYQAYRDAIVARRLKPGQRLPSTRSLALELDVSRAPVLAAFERLLAEGFLEGRVGAGTFVSANVVPNAPGRAERQRPGARAIGRAHANEAGGTPWLENLETFRVSRPALDRLPLETWSRIVAAEARRLPRRSYSYADPFGQPALREMLADYLAASRGVRCDPSQIMIASGSQQALVLCARVLLDPGEAVWFEEPGYGGARAAFELAGARTVPVPVDRDGLDVSAGIAQAPSARAAYVTPSHQYPLGVTMSAGRRLQLLDWARRAGAWIVEDDYDSEYRYESAPVNALQGLDGDARVLYIGTFSKVLFPSLRVGYLVIPKDLLAAFGRARDTLDIFPAPLVQAALTTFLREGHFARHLRRMRRLYRARRTALVEALEAEFGEGIRVIGAEAGMHLVMELPRGTDDRAISLRAARAGVAAMPLTSCYLGAPDRSGLVLGFGGTPESRMREGVKVLRAAIGRRGR
jgi:GntR family transcriptional regulator/MocR family aminotransferase